MMLYLVVECIQYVDMVVDFVFVIPILAASKQQKDQTMI